ncbi:MAG TPA: peptidoglycan-associated lipoprotein Pal [Thermodesulfovibrionales bacterium]|nr:peptidoglycan-associated lipoprotein Pal [Thermodesulfovibrionales bacterium]
MKRFIVLAAFIGFAVWGCAEQKAVTPPPQSQEMQPQQSQEDMERSRKGSERITEEPMAKIESRELPSAMAEISGMFKDILFDYDKYDLREDGKQTLKTVSDYLRKNTSHKVLIEGHCDERGTSEYNLALGDKRAKSAKDYLVSLGVPSARVDTLSYGKEKPACAEHTEECWAMNRRDHFVVLKGK